MREHFDISSHKCHGGCWRLSFPVSHGVSDHLYDPTRSGSSGLDEPLRSHQRLLGGNRPAITPLSPPRYENICCIKGGREKKIIGTSQSLENKLTRKLARDFILVLPLATKKTCRDY
jgi:hypothetical protein